MRSGVPLVVSLRRNPPDDSISTVALEISALYVCALRERKTGGDAKTRMAFLNARKGWWYDGA